MYPSRLTFAVLLTSISWAAQSAEDTESLDEEFLAYLAEFEGDEDDWTIVEVAPPIAKAEKPATNTADPPAPKSPAKAPLPKPVPPADGSKR